MRSSGIAIPLGGDFFPIATPRIQHVMKRIISKLNSERKDDRCEKKHVSNPYQLLREDLASISFVSSWNEDGNCIVTMNFRKPIYDTSEGNDTELISVSEKFCDDCLITTLILRSKKMKLIVGRTPPYIDDSLHIGFDGDGNFQVSLDNGNEGPIRNMQGNSPIYYRKPEDAFQHPNGNTMLQALAWMLNRLKLISETLRDSGHRNVYLLEMYCGCGAHTAAISKAGLFSTIVAVELDQRLVDACKENMVKNGATAKDYVNRIGMELMETSPVHVFKGDASEWASKMLLQKGNPESLPSKSSKKYWLYQDYQVLLVDPPRSGLGMQVCKLALDGSFDHIIYVSCGREALKEDIRILKQSFDVVNCLITDLFPRTSSVETLLHLKRRT